MIGESKPVVLDVKPMDAPHGRPHHRRPADENGDVEVDSGERGRPRRGRDGDRGRSRDSDRGRGPAEPRVPRQVKQLYPPPGALEEPPVEGAPKALPFASRRSPRGPMMREPGAEPPPKGKVRQLYPPAQFDEEYIEENGAPAPPSTERESEREPIDSMFVTAAEELDERRRLARERADARRGDDAFDASTPDATIVRPPFGGPFDDGEED